MIETDNLVLRPLDLSDLTEIAALFGSREVMAFSGDAPWGAEQCRDWILEQQEAVGCNLSLAVVYKKKDCVIGYIALQELPKDISLDVELVVSLMKDYWGQGYAQECLVAMVNYAFSRFDGLKRLVAVVHRDNIAVRSLAKKCGFKEVRELKLERVGPHVLYAINR